MADSEFTTHVIAEEQRECMSDSELRSNCSARQAPWIVDVIWQSRPESPFQCCTVANQLGHWQARSKSESGL
jgi:hypothetical protein